MRDHLMMGNVCWGRLLDLVEADRYALTLERNRSFTNVDGCWLDLEFIGTQLWTFLSQFAIGDQLYARRVQMVGGETYNGLELWRRLYVENKGGAEQVAMAGSRRLHNFPKCPDKSTLGTWLGEWTTLVRTHGHSYSKESLFVMLTSMLPEDVAKEIRDRKSVLFNIEKY